MAVGLLVGIWVARYLGPEKYGLLSYAQAFVGLFSSVASLGLDSIVVRELVRYSEKEKRLLGTVFVLKLFGAFISLGLLGMAIGFTNSDSLTKTLVFIVASAVIFHSFNVIDLYFQAKVMSKYVVYANSFSLLLSALVKIYLIFHQAPLEAFAWIVLFDSIIMAVGYLYWYWKLNKDFFLNHLQVDWRLAVTLLHDSWPLIFSGMVIAIYMRIDQVMIKEMLDDQAVGNYAAAVRLSEAWYFIPMVISSSLFPAIVNAKKVSDALYYQRLQRLYDFMVLLAVSIAVPMSFLSDMVVKILYGKEYQEASEVLSVHIWAGVFVFLGVVSSKWFVVENLQKYNLYRTVMGAFINIVLNFLFIPSYHLVGAAFATLVSQAFASYGFNIFHYKLHKNFKLQTKALIWPYRLTGV